MIKLINFILLYFTIANDIKIFSETYDQYNNITLPYINRIYKQNTKWINNIFTLRNNNLILYKNNNLIIVKDRVFIENNLYILAFPLKPIKTIRDLRNYHIPLLYEMKNKIIYIAQLYNISEDQLYIYFHYHPSYYYLHLHGSIISHPLLDTRYRRHFFIDEIINNLKNDSYYYKYKTLVFELKSNNKLFYLL